MTVHGCTAAGAVYPCWPPAVCGSSACIKEGSSHLPELPLPGPDADTVDAAADAYRYLATPDALLGLGRYAVTAILAAMGCGRRVQRQPWLPVAMSATVLADAVHAGTLTWAQWARHRALCFWCRTAVVVTRARVSLAFPETSAAVKRSWRRGRA